MITFRERQAIFDELAKREPNRILTDTVLDEIINLRAALQTVQSEIARRDARIAALEQALEIAKKGQFKPDASLLEEIDSLRQVCAEAYQLAGALNAPENALDNLFAAANGVPLPHESFLPVHAPAEIEQKPVAFEYHGRFSFAHQHENERPLYVTPPDAQAEIAKRDERIAELEEQVCGECDGDGWNYNAEEGRHACGCVAELEPYQLQAEEIAKRDARITELEATVKQCREIELELHKLVRLDGRHEDNAISIIRMCQAEIALLKAVIGKCELALDSCGQGRPSDDQDDGTYCNPDLVDEALAAIQEVK